MKRTALALALALAAASSSALADGMIIPVRPDVPIRGHWSVKYHHVKIAVKDQVASVNIDQSFVNDGAGDLEVEYLFPLPPEAAIHDMTLLVDGKEMPGKMMDAKEARKIYEDIVRRKKDPALLEYVGYGVYRTRAFPLQPNKPANVVISYTAVCKRDGGLVEVTYPLNTEKFSAKKIDSVRVSVDIKAPADILTVYSPTHDLKVEKDKQDSTHVTATYEVKNETPDTDFTVYYRAADEKIGATVLSCQSDSKSNGYFLTLVSPNPKTASGSVVAKNIVIVLDHSGSMAQDRKMDQAKEALKYVLGSLSPEDKFSVVAFSDSIDPVFNKLVEAGKKNIDEALESLVRVEASGGTNIADALSTALKMLPAGDSRPAYVLFITDGLPTVGERDEKTILGLAKKANEARARLFALGVGYDVNVRLIDNLVRSNRGVSDFVKPKEPLEAKISSLYNKVKRPVMTDVKLAFADTRVSLTYPQELPDLFDGGQILLVGRYEKGGKTELKVSGMLEGREQTFTYPVELQEPGGSNKNKFVERLWAVRRVGYLLDQIQLNGEAKEVTDELIRLSMEYGILTPYTAFLADDRVSLRSARELRGHAEAGAERLSKSDAGGMGQVDAMNRQAMNEATRAPTPSAKPAAAGAGQPAKAGSSSGVTMLGYDKEADYEQGKQKSLANVQNVGNQTLLRRGQVWMTPDTAKLDLSKDADQIKEVKQFSDEYFELVSRNNFDENQVLATQQAGEDLLIRLRGQVYRITTAPQGGSDKR